MTPPTFAAWAIALADELGIRLDPWHERLLDELERGTVELDYAAGRLELGDAALRRAHRRWRMAAAIAAAAIAGHRITVATPSTEVRRQVAQDAANLLEAYSRTCGSDVGLAREVVELAMR